MKHILIIGATGQIGSELTMELRRRYGNTNVVAGYIQGAEPKGELKESGPSAVVDVTNGEMIESVVKEYHIDTIYNLAALLSVVALPAAAAPAAEAQHLLNLQIPELLPLTDTLGKKWMAPTS